MNKEQWKAIAETQLDSHFIDAIVERVKVNLGKIIYDAKKECLERAPEEADEKRFSLKAAGENGAPKYAFYFDEKLVGHIGQNEFHGLDIIGNNYTITLEYTPVR
jgi:hypothetical protein